MMKKFINTSLVLGLIICLTSCRKYVEVPPVQTRVLRYTQDYLGLMQNTARMSNTYISPLYAADDLFTDDLRWQTTLTEPQRNAFTWAPDIYSSAEDVDWVVLYNQVLNCNLVLDGIMNSEEGTAALKQKGISYALVHRAFAYLNLVNLYGKQYDAATASGDPGVPLVLEPKFLTDLSRASVQKVYDQIKADLNTALPNLNDLPDYNTNPSKVAVYALLARVYLNTREFTEAAKYANLALGLQNTLLNLNDMGAPGPPIPPAVPLKGILNKEEILLKTTNGVLNFHPLSTELLNTFNLKTDLRYQLFTVDGTSLGGANYTNRGFFRFYKIEGIYVGPNVPEMMLIKAECAARANDVPTAINTLNALRVKRFKPADYQALSAADANAVLHLVVDERRREFVGRGFRWFDQRRLSKDPGFVSTVTRVFKGETFKIEPGSNRYTYPIASKYIQLNPEITQNPR